MGVFDDAAQELKGHVQDFKGRVKQNTGNKAEGTIDRIKGAYNKTASRVKSNLQVNHNNRI